jgi:hypothetical protein
MPKKPTPRRKPVQPPHRTPWLLVAIGLAAELVRLASEVLGALA